MHLSSLPYMLHSLPISVFLISSPEWYSVRNRDNNALVEVPIHLAQKLSILVFSVYVQLSLSRCCLSEILRGSQLQVPLLFVCLTASSHHVAAPLFRPCEAGASPDCTDSRRTVCEMKAQSRHIATTQPPWVLCSYASLTCSSCLLLHLFIYFFSPVSTLFILHQRFLIDCSLFLSPIIF